MIENYLLIILASQDENDLLLLSFMRGKGETVRADFSIFNIFLIQMTVSCANSMTIHLVCHNHVEVP